MTIVAVFAEHLGDEACRDGNLYGAVGNRNCFGGCWNDIDSPCHCICHLSRDLQLGPVKRTVTQWNNRGLV